MLAAISTGRWRTQKPASLCFASLVLVDFIATLATQKPCFAYFGGFLSRHWQPKRPASLASVGLYRETGNPNALLRWVFYRDTGNPNALLRWVFIATLATQTPCFGGILSRHWQPKRPASLRSASVDFYPDTGNSGEKPRTSPMFLRVTVAWLFPARCAAAAPYYSRRQKAVFTPQR